MRARTMLTLLVFASLSIVAVLLLRSNFAPESVAAMPSDKSLPILVAARPLPTGTLIQPQDVRWQNWPIDSLPPGRIERPSANPAKQQSAADILSSTETMGAVVRRDLPLGSPIVGDSVVKPGERDFLVAVLQPSMRAISVAVNAVSGAAGLIYPGDRVDLILAQTFNHDDFPLAKRAVGETIVQNLRVLAIDQRLQGKPENAGTEGRVARTVTLEATPRQAQQITVATELGRISLTLRSLAAIQGEPSHPGETAAPIWAEDVSPALRARAVALPPKPVVLVAARPPVQIMRGSQIEKLEQRN